MMLWSGLCTQKHDFFMKDESVIKILYVFLQKYVVGGAKAFAGGTFSSFFITICHNCR